MIVITVEDFTFTLNTLPKWSIHYIAMDNTDSSLHRLWYAYGHKPIIDSKVVYRVENDQYLGIDEINGLKHPDWEQSVFDINDCEITEIENWEKI